MIFEKILNLFLSIPLFKKLVLPAGVSNALKDFAGYLNQIKKFFNVDLLISCFEFCIFVSLIVAVISLVRRLLK